MAKRSCGHTDDTSNVEFNRASRCSNCWQYGESKLWPAVDQTPDSSGCPGSGERVMIRAARNRLAVLTYYAQVIRPRLGDATEQQQQVARRALTAVRSETSPQWWANHSDAAAIMAEAIRNEQSKWPLTPTPRGEA